MEQGTSSTDVKLRHLKDQWVNPSAHNGAVQAEIWDRVAEDYGKRTLPDFESDDFLKLIADTAAPSRITSSLDIGCGAGCYSLALADRVENAVGVDVSPGMIRLSTMRAKEFNKANASFHCVNWAEADIDDLRWKARFDIVFAHTTPAISDYTTFDKMNACSKNFCFLQKPTRRRDEVQDKAFELAGIRKSTEDPDKDTLYAFEYLWRKGYCPQMRYKQETWHNTRIIADMSAWCINRAKLKKELSAVDEAAITDYLTGIVSDGMVHETIHTTLVTLYWQV